jgi:hypothetical protein
MNKGLVIMFLLHTKNLWFTEFLTLAVILDCNGHVGYRPHGHLHIVSEGDHIYEFCEGV